MSTSCFCSVLLGLYHLVGSVNGIVACRSQQHLAVLVFTRFMLAQSSAG